jgi:hypothetical protein
MSFPIYQERHIDLALVKNEEDNQQEKDPTAKFGAPFQSDSRHHPVSETFDKQVFQN